MAFKVDNQKISRRAWGDVDKSALGKRLAAAYTAGDVTRAQIGEVYAYVPPDAFSKSDDGPQFAYSKAWGPHHEVAGDTIVLNANGVHAAAAALAGARAEPSLAGAALRSAKAHLRRHYRQLKEEPPDSLKESLRRIGKGAPLEALVAPGGKELDELVKGSLEYARMEIGTAFQRQFYPNGYDLGLGYAWICDTFADAVIVSTATLPPDEFYRVPFERRDGTYVFASVEDWELVELTYALVRSADTEGMDEGAGAGSGESAATKTGARKKFSERREVALTLDEAEGQTPRRIRGAKVMTADVVNDNGRRYPSAVVRAAVEELQTHLHESAGQGRLVQILGEADHPSDKGKRPSILETVVKWNEVSFDDRDVSVAGTILETQKGKDILALVRGGVTLALSIRAYGDSELVKENEQLVEEVTELHVTGIDLVLEPGFADAQAVVESRQDSNNEGDEMDPEKLKQFLKENADLFPGVTAEQVSEMNATQLAAFEEKMRAALGIDAGADLFATIGEALKAQKELTETKRKAAVAEAIAAATKDLKYGKLNQAFAQELTESNPATPEDVKRIAEAMKKRYDALLAQAKLANLGFAEATVTGPVIELDTDTPAFARPAFEIAEALVKRGHIKRRDLRKPQTVNERFTALVLERFDKQYQRQLLAEAKQLEEAETTTDLNLPYGVSRAVLAAVWAQAIAPGIFDYGVTDQAPTKIFYEQFAGESGLTGTVTDEAVTASNPLGSWVGLANKQLNPGSVVVTNSGASVTYVEGTDYVIDYFNGRFMALSTGAITAGQSLKVDYTYEAIRKGENAEIERAKMQLASMTLEIAADRLAQQVTAEAVAFSRSQLGWDATARTLASLINELRRKIDQAALYMGLTSALQVASNSGGAWNQATDPLSELPRVIGATRVKLAKRYYRPTAVVLSETNADILGNWEGFTAAGKRPSDDIDAEGYAGRVKGLPVFHSTEFSDAYGLVVNRELVAYRVYQALLIKGPFPTYSNNKLVAADQYYVEEMNGMDSPLPQKGSFCTIS